MSPDQVLLKQLLLRRNHPPVGILDGPLRRKVTPNVALLMLKSGTYEWCGPTKRVRKMRLIDVPRPWVPCYRTTEAPTIQPSIEWLRTRNTDGVGRSLVGTRDSANIGSAVRRGPNVVQCGHDVTVDHAVLAEPTEAVAQFARMQVEQ